MKPISRWVLDRELKKKNGDKKVCVAYVRSLRVGNSTKIIKLLYNRHALHPTLVVFLLISPRMTMMLGARMPNAPSAIRKRHTCSKHC